MMKGAGGKEVKRPEGVPSDAVDISPSSDGGLWKRIVTKGDDLRGLPRRGDQVRVRYEGSVLSSGQVFDQTRGKATFNFSIGADEVIKGWDYGVGSMRCGEKAELYVLPDYGYGEEGRPPHIAADSALKFEVELVDWGSPFDMVDDASEEEDAEVEGPRLDVERVLGVSEDTPVRRPEEFRKREL